MNSTNSDDHGARNAPAEPQLAVRSLPTVDLPKSVTFNELAAGGSEVLILHHGQQYRLRVTRNGGLILNK